MNDKEVKARLQEIGWTEQQAKMSSLDALGAADILESGEVIEHAVQGTIGKAKGLLLATNRRLVFVNRGIIKTQSESFRYDKISSVQYQTGFMSTSIALVIDGRTLKVESVLNTHGASFANYVRQRVDQGNAPIPAPASVSVDIADQLGRLADLRTKGILTEEEFQAQKQKLLS
jgi:hypothetical protein